jgi:hypothetical protein
MTRQNQEEIKPETQAQESNFASPIEDFDLSSAEKQKSWAKLVDGEAALAKNRSVRFQAAESDPREERHKPSVPVVTNAHSSPQPPPELALTDEQVERWAVLIANGHDQFPTEVAQPDRDRLLAAVRRRRRDRLVQHIAGLIALDLHRAPME